MSLIARAIDGTIREFFPGWQARRMQARATLGLLDRIEADAKKRGAAGQSGRLEARFRRAPQGPIDGTRSDLATTRAQARDLYKNNPYAHGIVNSIVANIVGCGMRPHPKVLNLKTAQPKETFNDAAETAWESWCYGCDPTGRKSFYQIQSMVERELIVVGEVLVVKSVSTDGRKIPLALEIIPSERLSVDIDKSLPGGNRIVQGVEFNPGGQIVAYHVHPVDPRESFVPVKSNAPERIPATRVLHLFDELEPGQVRGITRFKSTAGTFEAMNQWLDWVLTKERIASAFALMVTQQTPNLNLVNSADNPNIDDDDNELSNVEGGMFFKGRPGEALTGVSSGVQASNVSELTRAFIMQMSRGLDVAYELSSRDLSKVTYLSARQGENQDRRHWQPQQDYLNYNLNFPIWRAFIAAAMDMDAIPYTRAVDREYLMAVEFVPDGWDWIDPSKDVETTIAAIQAGIVSPIEAINGRGSDPWKILNDLEQFKRYAEDKGLTLSIFKPSVEADQADAAMQMQQQAQQEMPNDSEAA